MLTLEQIKNAQPTARRYELVDGQGLVLRVTPKGTKTWSAYVHSHGRHRRVTLGRFPEMGPRAARRARLQLRVELDQAEHMLFRELARLYLDHESRPRKRSAELDERILLGVIVPTEVKGGRYNITTPFGDLELPRIGRQQVLGVTDPIVARGATEQAARVHATLRATLAYAVRRGLLTVNPAAGAGIRQGAPRERVLTAAELTTWWPVFTRMAPVEVRLAVDLVFATGARITEVVGLDVRELDLVDNVWTIPPQRAKNRRPHALPLSRLALSLIEHARRHWPEASQLIPTSADSVRRWLRTTVEAAGIERVTPHDLRRTVATELARAGADRQTVDLILGHVDQSVGGIYDRYAREHEQRVALDRWGDRFEEVVTRTKLQSGPHPEITLARLNEGTNKG